VETWVADIAGAKLPTWFEVVSREYHPWNRDYIVIDTVGYKIAESVAQLREALRRTGVC
jgi:hypothetical protein